MIRPYLRTLARVLVLLLSELGSRTVAILTISLGAYIMARAIWPVEMRDEGGALGVGMIVAGGLSLVVGMMRTVPKADDGGSDE